MAEEDLIINNILKKHGVKKAKTEEKASTRNPYYASASQIDSMTNVSSLFDETQQERIKSIQEGIKDIEMMVEERKKLSQTIINDLDKIIFGVDKVLSKVDAFSKDSLEHNDIRGNMLKKKFDLTQAKADEQLNMWKDIAQLKVELREHKKELRELETRKNFLGGITEL